MTRHTRRTLQLGFVAAAVTVAVAATAWACTPQYHYAAVVPAAGPAGGTVAFTGYQQCTVLDPDAPPCPADTGPGPHTAGNLYMAAMTPKTTYELLIEPAWSPHPGSCTTDIGDVTWTRTGNVIEVVGTGTIPTTAALGPHAVCADPNPTVLWAYYVVKI